jgi:hypothetical protein
MLRDFNTEMINFCTPTGDVLVKDGKLDADLYSRWRNELWACKNPIRYPNTRSKRSNVQLTLCAGSDGDTRFMDYLEARYEIYYKEFEDCVCTMSFCRS